jgi:hypothetical protein
MGILPENSKKEYPVIDRALKAKAKKKKCARCLLLPKQNS